MEFVVQIHTVIIGFYIFKTKAFSVSYLSELFSGSLLRKVISNYNNREKELYGVVIDAVAV